MSIIDDLAGTIRKDDFLSLSEFCDSNGLTSALQDTSVFASLQKVASQGLLDAQDIKESILQKVATQRFDVVQLRPHGYGYILKVSAAPDNVAPQEAEVTRQEAQKAVPPEMVEKADEEGAATVTQVDAEPQVDPLEEVPQPITEFGVYKVVEAQSGKQYVGFVLPGLFDSMSGQPSPTTLFTNGNQFALSEEPLHGIPLGHSPSLPVSQVIRGQGVFYLTERGKVMATTPVNVLGEVTTPEGETYYSAQGMNGQDIQISMAPGTKRPVAAGPGQIIIPDTFSFMTLDNPIQIAGPEMAQAQAKQASAATRLRIEAWDDGVVRLSGPVFEKVGSGTHDNLADALFYLAAAGIPQNYASELIKVSSREGRPIDLYALTPLSTVEDSLQHSREKIASSLGIYDIPDKHNTVAEALVLEKLAASHVGVQTVDAVLSLNFLNPENISTFLDNLPQLEEASSKLAELNVAVDLGLNGVPPAAVQRAMTCMEEVISGLKGLKPLEV